MNDENPTLEQPQARSFEERLLARFDTMEARFAADINEVKARLDNVEARLASEMNEVKARLSLVESRLNNLEEKVEARLYDTRPIWESVLARLDSMDERFNSMDDKLDTFHRYLREFHKDTVDMRSRINRLEDIVLPPLS